MTVNIDKKIISKFNSITELAKDIISNQGIDNKITFIIVSNSHEVNLLSKSISFFDNTKKKLIFPDWEILAYDTISPHADLISKRLKFINDIALVKSSIVIANIETILCRLPDSNYIKKNILNLKVDDIIDINNWKKNLINLGYEITDNVTSHGEICIKGGIIDIFPMASEVPFRIELFDDTINSIRTFNPKNQISIQNINEISIFPAKEFPMDSNSIKLFKKNWLKLNPNKNPKKCIVYQSISKERTIQGIENYLPLFFENTNSIFDYIGGDYNIIMPENIESIIDNFRQKVEHRYEEYKYDPVRTIIKPDVLFFSKKEFLYKTENSSMYNIEQYNNELLNLPFKVKNSSSYIAHIKNILEKGYRVCIISETKSQSKLIINIAKDYNIQIIPIDKWQDFVKCESTIGIIVGFLDSGIMIEDNKIAIINHSFDISNFEDNYNVSKVKELSKNSVNVKNYDIFEENSYVTHNYHGIGIYRGLVTIENKNNSNEFIKIEYLDNDLIFVPITSINLINQYISNQIFDNTVELSKLGNSKWKNSLEKSIKKASDTASELLKIYAKREIKKGYAFNINEYDYEKFSSNFPFILTIDQKNSLEAIHYDMQQSKPMERLICGDVGFGKTELALRAAFISANNGKQTVILVPTTLLASQHYETFVERFSDWPFRIELISRFRSKKDIQDIFHDIEKGKIDIVISTHKLFSMNAKFSDLGLLVIDEEHRFGVKQKSNTINIKENIDVLTLTATPIPRTLNMALSGVKDISIISSPPKKRLSVKTIVRPYNNSLIKEAIDREIHRDGQVYFLHNKVETIYNKYSELKKLFPDYEIMIAHGQMKEKELESIMHSFCQNKFPILLCTTIIENGINITNVNTIIIERADLFGLSQLHQIRGRVGRTHHQGYAYLLTPKNYDVSKEADKRLSVLSNTNSLGAGYILSTQDLELRGSGEILGDKQSGDLKTIGYNIYNKILRKTVNSLKNGEIPSNDIISTNNIDIELNIPALIPNDFIGSVRQRLILYSKISNANNEKDLIDVRYEIEDRYGKLPHAVDNLFTISYYKQKFSIDNIKKINISSSKANIYLSERNKINPDEFIKLMQKDPAKYVLKSKYTFNINGNFTNLNDKKECLNEILEIVN